MEPYNAVLSAHSQLDIEESNATLAAKEEFLRMLRSGRAPRAGALQV